MSFTYEFGPAEEPNDQAKRLQLDEIIDAYGMVAEVNYHGATIGGRYPVNQIIIKESATGPSLTTIDYTITGNNLTGVTRTTGASTVALSSYEYSTDNDGNDTITSIESGGSVPQIQTIHLSPNYLQAGASVSVTHANLLQAVSDGEGAKFLRLSLIHI